MSKQQVGYLSLTLGWMGLIFWLSSLSTLPSVAVIWWDFGLKKLAHMLEYGILFWLWYKTLIAFNWSMGRAMLTSLMITLSYAVSDEWHQAWTPGRHPKITDVMFDSLGMMIAGMRIKRWI